MVTLHPELKLTDYATLLLHQAPQAPGRTDTTRRANTAAHAPVPFRPSF